MARVCNSCKFYTTGEETTCPKCNVALQFTLLPPPGQNAAPLAIDRASIPARPKRLPEPSSGSSFSLWDLYKGYRFTRALIATPIAIVLILGSMMFGWGKDSVYDRFDRIEIGMSEKEVRNILSPPRRGRHPTPEWANRPLVSSDGYAEFDQHEAGLTIHLEFMNGRVIDKYIEVTETAER